MKNKKFVTPPLHWLRAFEAAARHLNFTKAAEELCLTQSAVSKQVRLLEAHFRTELFTREHRGLQLSEAGKNYLPTILRAFRSLEAGTQTFMGYTEENNLHIKSHYSFAILWLGEHLDDFLIQHPEINVTVSTAHWEQEFDDGSSDVEIHYGNKELFDKNAIQLYEEKLFPVCAAELAHSIKTTDQLKNHIIYDLTGIRDSWSYWAEQSHIGTEQFATRHFLSSFALAYKLTTNGNGISLGQSSLVSGLLNRKELHIPLDNFVPGRDHYFICRGSSTKKQQYIETFLDWITEKMTKQLRQLEAV